VNEPFSFGTPERQRFTMQFGYNVRPSFWQKVQSNAHLVIAAIGTAALLGVAAVALWLCIPGSDRQVAAATAEQAVPTIPVKTTKVAPAAAAITVAAAPQAARKADAVSPAIAARAASIPALASNNPRWTASDATPPPAQAEDQPVQSKQAAEPSAAKSTDTAFAEPAAENDASDALSQVAAPAPAGETPTAGKKPSDKMDGAQTAAIPEAKPQVPDAEPAEDSATQAKPKPQKAGAAANGRVLRAVTMRSGPKKGAAAILTVPAKSSVQVMSCKQWCEIVYNGKHGWVYKSYVKTGA
jgi:hypothetical protein